MTKFFFRRKFTDKKIRFLSKKKNGRKKNH